jgi:hypothetical protein
MATQPDPETVRHRETWHDFAKFLFASTVGVAVLLLLMAAFLI